MISPRLRKFVIALFLIGAVLVLLALCALGWVALYLRAGT